MSISILGQRDLQSGQHHPIGVFSSPEKAYLIFKERFLKNHQPFTGGVFRYTDVEMFRYALQQTDRASILIYQNEMIEVFVQWNVLDQPLK